SARAAAAQHAARHASSGARRLPHRSGISHSGRRLSLSAQDRAPLTNPFRPANAPLARRRRGAEKAGPAHGLWLAPSFKVGGHYATLGVGDRSESRAASPIAGDPAGRSPAR